MTVHRRTKALARALARALPELPHRAALTCALAACAPPVETESPTATSPSPAPTTPSPAVAASAPADTSPTTSPSPAPTSPAVAASAPADTSPATSPSPAPTTSPAGTSPTSPTSPADTAPNATSPSVSGGPAATPSSPPRPAGPSTSASPARALDDFARDTPRCRPAARHCVGIHLHIVVVDGEPVQDIAWLSRQVDEAQERFAPIDVALEIRGVTALSADRRGIVSRSDRDHLGDGRFAPGLVHVFVVGSLADVDGPGEIRGVHWRQRGDRERRWIILSSIAGPLVLTHELGHFFGLPHSTYPASVMNKTEGPDRPLAERGFHERELPRMRRQRDAMLASGMIKARKHRP